MWTRPWCSGGPIGGSRMPLVSPIALRENVIYFMCCFSGALSFCSPCKAVGGIVAWYGQQGIAIPPQKVHFFGDRTENIAPFQATDFNAREISCKARDYAIGNGMVGLCGASVEEIVDDPGVAQCTDMHV